MPGAPVHLNLDGTTIAKIFLGQITNWNDPAIKALNKGASLPTSRSRRSTARTARARPTTSPTTSRLSRRSGSRRSANVHVGSVPAGHGARGSSGVAGLVSRTSGGITYVDVAFAIKNHIKFAAVKNRAGKFLYPSLRRITAAAAAFPKVPANNEMHIVNPPKSAPLAYPICTYTYVIVPQQTSHAAELRKLIFWALTQGQKTQYTAKLLFAPLPKPCSSPPRRR